MWWVLNRILYIIELVYTRAAKIQCVDVLIYCLYIVRYEMESKHCSVLLLREINDVFFSLRSTMYDLG